jgi:hypothetical protein
VIVVRNSPLQLPIRRFSVSAAIPRPSGAKHAVKPKRMTTRVAVVMVVVVAVIGPMHRKELQ